MAAGATQGHETHHETHETKKEEKKKEGTSPLAIAMIAVIGAIAIGLLVGPYLPPPGRNYGPGYAPSAPNYGPGPGTYGPQAGPASVPRNPQGLAMCPQIAASPGSTLGNTQVLGPILAANGYVEAGLNQQGQTVWQCSRPGGIDYGSPPWQISQ